MVRKAGATDKKGKGSKNSETYMPGVTEAADYLQQQMSESGGAKLDHSVIRAANKNASEVFEKTK